jgi:Chaperone of endosialidase
MKTTIPLLLITFSLTFDGLPSKSDAVSPPPDGGYPNFTTAEGQNALLHLSSGSGNTAAGWFSLESVTTGSFNTGIGAGTLLLNTGDDNTATGVASLLLNTTGANNTANETAALVNNSTGSDNTAIGAFALNNNTASGNTAIGSGALLSNTTGGALGNVEGFDVGPNVAVGQQALESNTLASANTAVGYQALQNFTTGSVGSEQFGACTAVGFQALINSTTDGNGNSGFGYQALFNNIGGAINTAVGLQALFSNTTGNGSTAVGIFALHNSTGHDNTALGNNAGSNVTSASNVICIGATGNDVSNSCFIGNIFGQTSAGGTPVLVNPFGQLGTMTSSQRFKEEIRPMEQASEALFSLKPVTFRYKKEIDPTSTPQLGLVAEEVEKVSPALVVRDKEGKPYSVRYDQVNSMLLNEFLKEHQRVQEQQKEIEALEAELKEQRDLIQKVSDKVEMSEADRSTVVTNY